MPGFEIERNNEDVLAVVEIGDRRVVVDVVEGDCFCPAAVDHLRCHRWDLVQQVDSSILGKDTRTCPRNFRKWREHLTKSLTLPMRVTGTEDYPWEEPYVFWGRDRKEYERLKKSRPSYSDVFDLLEILEEPSDDDLVAVVKRVSGRKVFHIGLSWLEVHGLNEEARVMLNDYSVWQCNC